MHKATSSSERTILRAAGLISESSSNGSADHSPMTIQRDTVQPYNETNLQEKDISQENEQMENVVEKDEAYHTLSTEAGGQGHGSVGEMPKESKSVATKGMNFQDAIHIFNKFEALEYQEHLEVRSAFGYEDETVEDNSAKSDGEVQSLRKTRRKKQVPPFTVLTRSSAKQGMPHNKL